MPLSHNTITKQTDILLQKINNDPVVKPRIEDMKLISSSKNNNDLKSSDRICNNIMAIAEHLEKMYDSFGMNVLIEDVCNNIVKLLELNDLDMYIYLPVRILPDKYKNPNKDTSRYVERKLAYDRLKKNLHDSESVQIKILDEHSIREIRDKYANEIDRLEKELKTRNVPLYEIQQDALGDLKEHEKNKFHTASIGKPIATPDELCEKNVDEYKESFEELKKTCKQFIKAAEIFYQWFCEKYPPLDTEDCKKLNGALKEWLEVFRPYFDNKYRMDHAKARNIAVTKVIDTSTKASKESKVRCANIVDKNGNPVLRAITKEQIDATYEWEINYWNRLYNVGMTWVDMISEVNAKHGERCKADRAVELSEVLSHHA